MGGGGTQKQSRSTGTMPWWAQGAHRSLIGNAENFAYGDRGGYTPYNQPRIAGLTGAEQSANSARGDLYNRGDVAGQYAADQLGLASGATGEMRDVAFSEFDMDEYERRKNPYMEGVIGSQLREANRSFDRRLNQDEASSVARGGSIGSYRVGLENAFLEGERAESLGDIRNRGEAAAYDQALQSFESDRNTRMGGLGSQASQYGQIAAGANQLGTASQAREIGMINELDRSGAIERELQQRELDMAYGDFQEERDWPQQRMSWLSGVLSGVPSQIGSQATSTPQPGIVSQLTGLGLGAAAIGQLVGGGGE